MKKCYRGPGSFLLVVDLPCTYYVYYFEYCQIFTGTPLLTSKWLPFWYSWDRGHLTGLQPEVHTWNEGIGFTRTSLPMHDVYKWQVTICKCHIWLRHEVGLWFWSHKSGKLNHDPSLCSGPLIMQRLLFTAVLQLAQILMFKRTYGTFRKVFTKMLCKEKQLPSLLKCRLPG